MQKQQTGNCDYTSSEEDYDLQNFKGLYDDDESEKYFCPDTGAHFNFDKIYDLLTELKNIREQTNETFICEGEVTRNRSTNLSENFGDDMDECS